MIGEIQMVYGKYRRLFCNYCYETYSREYYSIGHRLIGHCNAGGCNHIEFSSRCYDHKYTCATCKQFCNLRLVWYCEYCRLPNHDTCTSIECDACETKICKNCISKCASCGKDYCLNCLIRDKILCSKCIGVEGHYYCDICDLTLSIQFKVF